MRLIMPFFTLLAITVITVITANAALQGVVQTVSDNTITVQAQGALKGSSAFVVHRYAGGETISQACVVQSVSGDTATLLCKPFDYFDQDSIPTLNLKPKRGDTVLFVPLMHSAVIIAPTVERYVRAQEAHRDMHLVHPDLFAAMLTNDSNPKPTPADFAAFCSRQMVGVVILALSDADYMLDCDSFGLLAKKPENSAAGQAVMPFFHRLNVINKSWWTKTRPIPITEFDDYYKQFIQKEFNAIR